MACSVYILQSDTSGRFYVGSAEDVSERVREHNAGVSQYTRHRGSWRLVYSRAFASRSEAMKREYEIKSMKSRKYIEDLIGKSSIPGA